MEKILITGHKIPDADSICSAISYTELKHAQGVENAVACRLGKVSRETQYALDHFGAEAPLFLDNVNPDADGTKKKVILVDHNERFQTPDGIENAKILEVIDHHKFNLITDEPLKIVADTVGCTSTIVYRLYKQAGITPSKRAAGLMMSAIISDTLLFKSPTCTPEDVEAVKELSKLAGEENYEEYGMKLLIEGTTLSDKTPDEIITMDMKEFDMNGKTVAIAQVNTVDTKGTLSMQADLEKAMNDRINAKGYDLFVLIITDIVKAGSYVLATGKSPELVEKGFKVTLENNTAWLEGVVSRKKQVVPFMLEASK